MISVGAISHPRTKKHDMRGVPATFQDNFSKGKVRERAEAANIYVSGAPTVPWV